ncbi:hypothetical protein B0H13DRAFT_1074380 [Mycena leptocephala]|nr:hypothetical protein B0H13DRAFT_1074380 [Mycena leptocephala]
MDVSVTSEVFNTPPQENMVSPSRWDPLSGTAMEIPTPARDDEAQDASQIGTETSPPDSWQLNPLRSVDDMITEMLRQVVETASRAVADMRQIEPATSPPDPLLLGEPHLPLSPSLYSLLELLEKIYQDYASTSVFLWRLIWRAKSQKKNPSRWLPQRI